MILLAASVCGFPARTSRAQEAPTEYQVKAAYLFNFLKFVEWPGDPVANTNGRWVIGIVGENPFGNDLAQAVSGKSVQGHLMEVKSFQLGDDLRTCQILYIGDSEKKRVSSILSGLHGASVLTVADTDRFTESGGMIQFVMEDKRVRFGIDVGAASRAHLKISSKLLSLARTVTGTEQVGLN